MRFSLSEGRVANEFYRSGPVAAHVVLSSGPAPRLVFAFPAGNSGAGIWFRETDAPVSWGAVQNLEGVHLSSANGDPLYGVQLVVTLNTPSLTIDRAILGSVRSLRDYGYTGSVPEAIAVAPTVGDRQVVWQRERLDGRGGYRLSFEALDGDIVRSAAGDIDLLADADGRLRLRIAALTGDEPLTPIGVDDVVTAAAADDSRSEQVLAFLSYEEKLLAGSWRFLTYFGRDTLLTLQMLMDVATPAVVEAGLGSVLERLSEHGEVAHEEEIGEYPILRRAGASEPLGAAPIFDYKMIDDDFMLAPVAAAYLLDRPERRSRAAAFLQRPTRRGDRYGDALLRNLEYVVASSRAFAARPDAGALIHLKAGEPAGNWRDSDEGLGGGRIPYDVNAVLVPAALRAVARLVDSGILDAYAGASRELAEEARSLAAIWERQAPALFRVRIGNGTARQRVAAYAAELGIPAAAALDALGRDEVIFNAIALDADGRPIAVLHSDESFALAFSDPDPDVLERMLAAIMRPYPAGLMSPAGLLVANPAYASDAARWPAFADHRYHGSVVWSWQQALLAAGLSRQARRSDIGESLRTRLLAVQHALWSVIEAGEAVRTSELWSWSFGDGRFTIEPFGQRRADATESNAAQLWSTVYLGVRRPARR